MVKKFGGNKHKLSGMDSSPQQMMAQMQRMMPCVMNTKWYDETNDGKYMYLSGKLKF